MKLIKRLLLAIILLLLLSLGAFYWWSIENSPPDALNQHQPPEGLALPVLNAMAGLYENDAGERMLLAPSARGGLMLFRADDFVLDHDSIVIPQLDRDDAGDWWVTRHDGKRLPVELFGSDRKVTAMRWPDYKLTRIRKPAYEVVAAEFSSDIALSGTLFIPDSGKPVPGAVIIHGSGTSDRDGLWYLLVARALAENGVAVLLPDKRGSGRSSGEWRTASFADFAGDALAAARVLEDRPEVATGNVGLVGLSQGGRIAPIAAGMSPGIAFAVSVSSAAVPPEEQVRHEIRRQMIEKGVPELLTHVLMPIAAQMPERRRPEWWRQNGAIDPIASWQAIGTPGLVFYGGEDEKDNVPVKRSVSRLVSLGKPESELKVSVISGVGHSLTESGSGQLHPRFREELAQWIHAVSDIPDPVASKCRGVPLSTGDFIVATAELSGREVKLALSPSRSVMLDSAYVELAGMELMTARDAGYVGTVSIGKAGAERQVPSFVTGKELSAGAITQAIPAALVVDLRGPYGESFSGIDGLLGTDFFEDHVLDINLPGHCLRLIPRDRFRAPAHALTVKRRNDQPVVEGRINFNDEQGFDVLLLLDFSMADTIRLGREFVAEHGLADSLPTTVPDDMDAGPGGEPESVQAEAGQVSIGSSTWSGTSVSLAQVQQGTDITPPWDGAIGIELLKTRRVVYDPDEGKLWLLGGEEGTQ